MDLVVFDLSDMNAIKEAGRVKDIFPNYYRNPPGQVSFVDFENFDHTTEVIIGYITESRKIEYARNDLVNEPFFSEADGGGSGTGGSMARFTINDELLYIAEESELSVVDISNPSNPVELSSEGLKIFDTKNTPDLSLVDQFTNINTYDVIPLDDKLLMIGDNTLSQYSYKGNEVNLISTFSLN